LTETIDVTTELAHFMSEVHVLGAVGERVGVVAFGDAVTGFATNIRVSESRPSAAALSELMPTADIIFYSGHGHPAGLCLASSADRDSEDLRLDHILATPLMRSPIVLLSACSTAQENGLASSDSYSLASWFLRSGAQFVVGGLWEVIDEHSAAFFRAFARRIRREDPRLAFAEALRELRRNSPDDVLMWSPFVALSARGAA
jgi:hypothetical protein